eukprot:TRINITY_DN67227_c8_g3_i1.p1 TRINITY_DN67227_c8_g3~~TRINITY_DN67227_c8_g3_i1.p1  ORF type:complete len:331 (+),score=5.68 TRINITY_DN67227_c8_g3_i1:30-1022(+)
MRLLVVVLWGLISCTHQLHHLHPVQPNSAYFRLAPADLADPQWPDLYRNYSVFVVYPMTAQEILKIKRDVPGAQVLYYTCTSWVYINKGCSKPHAGFQANSTYFSPSWAVTDTRTGNPVCPFGRTPGKESTVAAYVPFKQSVDGLVRYYTDVILSLPYSGIYLDQFGDTWPNSWKRQVETLTSGNFAIDGTDKKATLKDLDTQYAKWKPYLGEQLRKALGDHRVFIANPSFPFTPAPELNGITIEFEHCHHNFPGCIKTLREQRAAGHQWPPVFALWLTHSNVVPAPTQCSELVQAQKQLPFHVMLGEDIRDCTREHIPCVWCNVTTLQL